MNTQVLPATKLSGGPTQMASDPTVAAGTPPISTVGVPGVDTAPPT
ncbi:hypothetical protein F385_3402 [Pantoea agglomerans 299R]|nr:hypothetical protein F385_3402 [Pantoea agglomerans 299R]